MKILKPQGNHKVKAQNAGDEKFVIRLARAGQDEAKGQLTRLYLNRAYRFALRLTQNRHDAEELVRAAFAELFQNLTRYDESFAFSAWFYQIIIHQYLKLRRKRRLLAGIFPFFLKDTIDPDAFESPGDSPGIALTQKEEKKILLKAIRKLPQAQQLTVTLYDLEGLPQKEIAEILEIPAAEVMSRLHSGRQKLLESLTPYLKENG
ncbi:ECF RNA polymerase sigma factor SigH [bacterium BMS3Abin05]|nr:ECF RNA polymerase sigma factor SigH [bacterium BMS3Abin05]GBE26593.1 ECF RNA polymerase sigma factor SigH [bacterium BMS3Bbin03]